MKHSASFTFPSARHSFARTVRAHRINILVEYCILRALAISHNHHDEVASSSLPYTISLNLYDSLDLLIARYRVFTRIFIPRITTITMIISFFSFAPSQSRKFVVHVARERSQSLTTRRWSLCALICLFGPALNESLWYVPKQSYWSILRRHDANSPL